MLLCTLHEMQAQPTGVNYQSVWSAVSTSSATVPTTVVIKNTGQVSHQLVWNFTTKTGGSFNCPAKIATKNATIPYDSGTNYFTFFIEGSFDGTTYQRLNSVTQLLKYEQDSLSTPAIVPAFSGNLTVNSSAPYIRVGFTNNTRFGVGTDVFSDCALNANYVGTTTYNSTLDTGGIGDGTDNFVRQTFSAGSAGYNELIPAISFGSWTSSKWLNRTSLFVYAFTVCNITAPQDISFSGTPLVTKLSLYSLPTGCMEFPYTGRAYFKVSSDAGFGVWLTSATNVRLQMTLRLENRE